MRHPILSLAMDRFVDFGRRPLSLNKRSDQRAGPLCLHYSQPQGAGEWLHPLRSISSPLHPTSSELSRRRLCVLGVAPAKAGAATANIRLKAIIDTRAFMGVSSDAICICIIGIRLMPCRCWTCYSGSREEVSQPGRRPKPTRAHFILRSNSGQFVLSPVAAVSPDRKGEVATRRFIQPVAACGEPSAVALSFRQAPHASANRPLSRGGSAQYQRQEKPR